MGQVRKTFLFGAMLVMGGCAADQSQVPGQTPPVYIPLNSPQIAWIFGEWTGQSGLRTKRIVVGADPEVLIYEQHHNQVSSPDDTTMPFPTYCSYRYYASQYGIKQGGTGSGAEASQYTFVTHLDRIEMIQEDGNSPTNDCATFEAAETDNIASAMVYIFNFSEGTGEQLLEGDWLLQKTTSTPSPAPSARRR